MRYRSPLATSSARIALAAAWLAPLLAGALARTWSLHLQVYSGDETHAVWSALFMPLSEILVTYRLADHCIPLAAFYRLLVRSGVGLSEVVLRAPAALSGLAATVVLPLLVLRWARTGPAREDGGATGARWAALYCALLAISPSLIYYSRIARPYAIVAFLAPLAAAAFWRWWRGGGPGWAVLWVVAGGLSAWFHLGTAPFVAAPLLWAGGDLLFGRRRRLADPAAPEPDRRSPGWLALLAAGAGLAMALAAFLVPAHASLLRLMRRKGGAAEGVDAAALWDVARLQAGSAWPWVAVLFWLAVAASFVAALRRGGRARVAAIYGATLVAGQWLAITLVLRPDAYNLPVVLNRYVLVTLPVVLLALAWGLAVLWRWLAERGAVGRGLGAAAAILAVAGLAAAGPYAAEPALRLGPFAGHPTAISFLTPATRIPLDRVPAVYSLIAREAGEGAVLEITAGPAGMFQVPALAFWRVHRRPVIVTFDKEIAADPRLRLRTLAGLEPALMEASGARFVVLHLDLPRFRRLDRDGPGSPGAERTTPPDHEGLVRARRMGAELTAVWGEPDLVDGPEWVWDMERVRRTGRSAAHPSRSIPAGPGRGDEADGAR